MRLLYTSAQFLEHKTGPHPECPQRLERVVAELAPTAGWKAWEQPMWQPATHNDLTRVHTPEHVKAVEDFAAHGGGMMEADTVVSRQSCNVARWAAGAVVDAVRQVVRAPQGARAVCLVRPPGHHALPHAPMGFCLFNNIAVAARVATQELKLDRILIVDWDVHHGNGTQNAFYRDPQVGFLSIHRAPFYPGTGAQDETGAGPGLGTIKNVPIAWGTSRDSYQGQFRRALEHFADSFRPELVLVSAGFDAHRLDPIGSLGLETEDYTWLTEDLVHVANTHSHGRIVSVLEGGYNIAVLPQCVALHMDALALP